MIDWTHWHNEPFLTGGLIFLGWLYAVLTGPLRARLAPPGTPYPRRHAVSRFYAALIIFYLAVGSPLDQIAERYLLSAHMLQHQILIYPAAVLFLLGLPDWLVRPVTAQPSLQGLLRVLTYPLVCGAIYTVVYSGWHLPSLYDWALQNRLVHIAEHFMMFARRCSIWWPHAQSVEGVPARQLCHADALPARGHHRHDPGLRLHHVLVRHPLPDLRVCAADLSATTPPKDDQLLAGVMMKLIGMSVACHRLWSRLRLQFLHCSPGPIRTNLTL